MGDVLPPQRPERPPVERWEKTGALALAARIIGRLLNEVPRGTGPETIWETSNRIVEEETRGLSREQKRQATWFINRVVESVAASED